jgi:hypothetical protein
VKDRRCEVITTTVDVRQMQAALGIQIAVTVKTQERLIEAPGCAADPPRLRR